MFATDQLLDLGSALAAGLLIGIERGWTLRGEAVGMRVAGIRTFILLGLVAGIAGILNTTGYALVSAIIVAGTFTIIAIGYARSVTSSGKPDATSAIGAAVTLALGFLGGIGEASFAVAGAAVVTLILAFRSEMHGLIGRLDKADMKALARYAAIALAVFPFLPEGRYGPYDAWDPRTLWFVVVIVTGFSFLGYAANRIFGSRRGTMATAIVGGAYSSTAVTQSFAQRLGSGAGGAAENAGIALATAVMYLRVVTLVAFIAGPILRPFLTLLAAPIVIGFIVAYLLARRAPHSTGPAPPGNPIALVPALSFVVFVAIAAVAARWAQGRFGEGGIAILLLLMGSMDVDAAIVTAGGLEPGKISDQVAALAITGTVLANMTVKLGVTIAYGRKAARPAAIALGASIVALAGSMAIGYVRM